MSNECQKPDLKVMIVITGSKEAKKAETVLKGLPLQFLCHGEGTASNEILDYLGIGTSRRAVLLYVLPKALIPDVYEVLINDLYIDRHGNGVAFTLPVSAASMLAMEMCNEKFRDKIMSQMENKESEVNQMSNNITHGLVIVTINQGFSDDVMAAAKAVGAFGGTVLYARGLGSEEIMKTWGISVQKEKEIILILAKKENKLDIMKAISEKCGAHSEAQGIVVSLPVDTVIGIQESTPKSFS